ncbi:biotin transporter BioY [Facklamia sp. DSM 111018]|uniref:Biotin transporter n=1 Tax=Facklamia lactis TaxID=2749967 RepID=A0ABS0LMN7_9LACT|nr:biotin transporter BioY [Facklamia lactis]MBG9979892.1 biotin transporter BioY [Facklamia lactis]MBG9985428.1 biotin transporter BioY [Facklamia lactis]
MKTQEITRIAIAIALLTVASQLTIPIGPVPITLQTLVVLIIGLTLNKREAFVSLVLYLVLGLVGLPVFAGFSGGFSSVLSPSFGFLLSFPISGYLLARLRELTIPLVINVGLASCLIYIIGLIYMAVILNIYLDKNLGMMQILSLAMFPFIPGDIGKAIIAVIVSRRLNKKFS